MKESVLVGSGGLALWNSCIREEQRPLGGGGQRAKYDQHFTLAAGEDLAAATSTCLPCCHPLLTPPQGGHGPQITSGPLGAPRKICRERKFLSQAEFEIKAR
ncbi:hypothetical protein E2C01_056669 [Portunus trituberculatus]|uniref:Uncharacterized protein n=1 Tax=Portunus trituberculatus TaxID=210409 RepID=A0A5B7GY26_PORTR|nr:hypothetical protein [Portunus trituberculatus]